MRTADQSADGRRSAASRTAIGGGGHIVSPPRGDNSTGRLVFYAMHGLKQCSVSHLSGDEERHVNNDLGGDLRVRHDVVVVVKR